MRIDDFKFRVTHKRSGKSAILTLNDLYGYEGEVCGILIRPDLDVPEELRGEVLVYNSGYGFNGGNDEFDIG